MSYEKFCLGCRKSIQYATCTGYSSLYNPRGSDIELCEPCFLAEDELIEEKGTNDIPEELERYKSNRKLGPI